MFLAFPIAPRSRFWRHTEDGLYQPNQSLIAWLKSNGMTPTAISTPGMHAWMVWRENLSAFAPLLFKTE